MSKAKADRMELDWRFLGHTWRTQSHDKKVDTGLNVDLNGMVREATQNSNDAKIDGSPSPAKISYKLLLLSGIAKDNFLAAGKLDGIKQRIGAATENKHLNYGNSGLKARLIESHERLEALASTVLPVLVITDEGTKGLKGEDSDEDSSFHTFTHTIGRSQDKGDGKGGSHGVGKGLLWELSAFRTIFMATVDSDRPEKGTRFYGVSNNVEHSLKGKKYTGVGFFGAPDGESEEHALSVFNPDQDILDALFLESPKPSGLSICIPGLIPNDAEIADVLWQKIAKKNSSVDASDAAKEISAALIRSFWPALAWRRFEAKVTCEAVGATRQLLFEEKIDRGVINSRPEFMRLSAAFDKASNAIPDDNPEKGISSHVLDVRVPKGHQASKEDSPQVDAAAVLVLAHLDDSEVRSVQTVRGTGMVIDASYVNFGEFPEGPGWAGMLLAGKAVERHRTLGEKTTPHIAKAFDKFLTYCEGATHVRWSAEEQTAVAIYKKSPTQSALRALRSRVKEEIRITLQGIEEDRDEFPAWFDLARIVGPKPPGPKRFYMRAANRVNKDNSVELTAMFDLGKKKSSVPLRLRASLINEKGPSVISLKDISVTGKDIDLNQIGPTAGEIQLQLRFVNLRINAARAGIKVWLERDRDEGVDQ